MDMDVNTKDRNVRFVIVGLVRRINGSRKISSSIENCTLQFHFDDVIRVKISRLSKRASARC